MKPADVNQPVIGATASHRKRLDPDELYEKVEERPAYYIVDNRVYWIYALPTELRKTYISEELRSQLQKTTRNWGISEYRATGEVLKQANCEALLAAASSKKPEALDLLQLTPATPENPTPLSGFHWKLNPNHAPNDQLTLPDPVQAAPQQEITLLNGDKKRPLTITNGSDTITVLPGEAAFFICKVIKGKKIWKQTGYYHTTRTKIRTNPLVRDYGPRLSDKTGQGLGVKRAIGEYFLPFNIVTELAIMQSADRKTRYPSLALGQDNRDFIQDIQAQLQEQEGGCSFLVHNPSSEHMLAARVIRRGNDLVCYIHEGLGKNEDPNQPESQIKELQKAICSSLHKAFPDASIRCLTPADVLQRDYYSCGVVALKALRAFRKTPDFDNSMYSAAMSLASPVTWHPLMSGVTATAMYDSTEIKPSYLPLESIPPRLLKMYQGSLRAIPDTLKKTIVSGDNITLGEYLDQHKRTKGAAEQHTINLAPFGKRYIYINEWFDSHPELWTTKPEHQILIPPVRQASQKAWAGAKRTQKFQSQKVKKKKPTLEFTSPFSATFEAQSSAEANEILKQTGYPHVHVTDHDFRMSCEFFAYVQNRVDSFCDHKAKPLNQWLIELLSTDTQPDSKKQLLQHWCLFAIRTDIDWHDKDLEWVQKDLERYIKRLSPDKSLWRNYSDSADEEETDSDEDTISCNKDDQMETQSLDSSDRDDRMDILSPVSPDRSSWQETPIDKTHPFYKLLTIIIDSEMHRNLLTFVDKELKTFQIPDVARLNELSLTLQTNSYLMLRPAAEHDYSSDLQPLIPEPVYLSSDIFQEGKTYKLTETGLARLEMS